MLGLAPDPASGRAAGTVAKPAKWGGTGCDDLAVWGECQGSGSSAYRVCVDLSEPAFRCSCPSRKFPCKHALGLLLLWSDGAASAAEQPAWVAEWLEQRQHRTEQKARQPVAKTTDPKTAQRREQRVDDGIDELDRWLRDQVTQGLSQTEQAPYSLWDEAARRLVDAQAGALAGQVRALATIPRRGPDWPERLLEEYGLLRLLVRAHQRRDELPEALRETVRARVGFTLSHDEVLREAPVRDHWYVAGVRDSEQEQLITRRIWLRGGATGRSALVLSFGAPGRALDASLVPGTTLDADLAFYPGAQPLRAIVATRHGAPAQERPPGVTVTAFLAEYAQAVRRDPWLDRWPAVFADVRLSRDRHLIDPNGDALPLESADLWGLLALSGGEPITVAGEWTPRGLLPLSAWHERDGVITL